MVNALKIFLQNIKIWYHVVLKSFQVFFLIRLIFPKTRAITALLVNHGRICNTGISVEQDRNE